MPKTKTSPAAPRGMGRITRNPNGTWTLRYTLGKRQPEETFSTEDLAIDRQAEIWRQKRAGETVFAGKGSESRLFTDYCREWISSGARRESTATVYRSTLNCMLRIAPELEHMTVAQVAKDRPLAKRLIQQAPASYKKRIRTLLLSPCNEAQDDELIERHNLARLGKSAGIRETSRRAEFSYIEREDLERFAGELAPTDRCTTDYGVLVWIQRLAGLRISEALGLHKNDFRDGGTVLWVERQRLVNGDLCADLKTSKSRRQVPVPAKLWEMVKDAPTYDGGYLFPKAWHKSVYDRIKKAQAAAGIPPEFVPHWLRHMYASDMLAAYIPITDLKVYLGHSTIKETCDTYGHLVPSAHDRAREVFASWDAKPALTIVA